MIVYRITNRVNGKVYIGKTVHTLVQRWKWHLADARGNRYQTHFYKALRKYGPEAFTIEILYQAKTKFELSRMETFFIVLHQSYRAENGYNGTLGGDGAAVGNKCAVGKRTLEQRQRMSEVAKASFLLGREPWNKGKTGFNKSSETRTKLAAAGRKRRQSAATKSKLSKQRMGEGNPMYGRLFSDQHCARMSAGIKRFWENMTASQRQKQGELIGTGLRNRTLKMESAGCL